MADFRILRSELRDPSDPDQVAWDVIEPMYEELRTPYEADDRLLTCTLGQRSLYALHWTRSEVINGGFEKFFVNSTGSLWTEAVAGARRIGADDYAEVIARAALVFPDGRVPAGRRQRNEVLQIDRRKGSGAQGASTILDECDEAFYALLDDGERALPILLAGYVREHPEEFFRPVA